MAYFQFRQALVNRAGQSIPVYGKRVHQDGFFGSLTVGGSKIGEIYPNEFFTIVPDESPNVTSYLIYFQNPSGKQATGYIETSRGMTLPDYEWAAYQEPYQYYNSNGTTLVKAEREVIGGTNYYIFTVHSPRPYVTPSGVMQNGLPVGTKLATTSSTTGQTLGGYMLFNKKKLPNGSWQDLVPSGYGFVDLGLNVGSFPSNRPIR